MILNRVFLFVVCINAAASVFPSFSQDLRKVDSLITLVKTSADTQAYEHLINIVRIYSDRDNFEALRWAERALSYADRSGDSMCIVKANRVMGQLTMRLSRYNEAEKFLLKALSISKRQNFLEINKRILVSLSVCYTYQAKYDQALLLNFQLLDFYKEDDYDRSAVLTNTGLVYYKLNDYYKSIEYIEASLKLRKMHNNKDFVDRLLVNAALAYACIDNFSKAKVLADSALVVCGHQCSDILIMERNFTLGVIHFKSKNIEEAEKYFIKSYTLAKTLGDDRFQLDNIDYLTDINMKKGHYDLALKYLRAGEGLTAKGEMLNAERIKMQHRFIELYTNQKNFQKAAYHQQKYIQLKDSTYTQTLRANLMEAEAQFEERKNQSRIKTQQQILTLDEAAIKSRQWLNAMIAAIAFILLGIALMLIKSYRQKSAINKLLKEKVQVRTQELEFSRDQLLVANHELSKVFDRTTAELVVYQLTIHELFTTLVKEDYDPILCLCIDKLRAAAFDLRSKIGNQIRSGI